jgi:hypothetical protein
MATPEQKEMGHPDQGVLLATTVACGGASFARNRGARSTFGADLTMLERRQVRQIEHHLPLALLAQAADLAALAR